jgi:uncharacterized protein (TIGR00251 family)
MAAQSKPAPVPVPQCTLEVKAVPGAPRSEVCGWLGSQLKVKVKAPPVEGKANEVLVCFLAETLGLPRRNVELLRGDTSRQKIFRITGLSESELRARLGS